MYYVKENLNLNAFGILCELMELTDPVRVYKHILENIPEYFAPFEEGMYAFGMDRDEAYYAECTIVKKPMEDEIGFLFLDTKRSEKVDAYPIKKSIEYYTDNKFNLEKIQGRLYNLYAEQISIFSYDKKYFKSLELYESIRKEIINILDKVVEIDKQNKFDILYNKNKNEADAESLYDIGYIDLELCIPYINHSQYCYDEGIRTSIHVKIDKTINYIASKTSFDHLEHDEIIELFCNKFIHILGDLIKDSSKEQYIKFEEIIKILKNKKEKS